MVMDPSPFAEMLLDRVMTIPSRWSQRILRFRAIWEITVHRRRVRSWRCSARSGTRFYIRNYVKLVGQLLTAAARSVSADRIESADQLR